MKHGAFQSVSRALRRQFLCIFTLAILAAVLSSCGGSSTDGHEAERVAVRWLRAMSAADVKAACQLMDAENHHPRPDYPTWSGARNCEETWRHSDNTPLDWAPKPQAVTIWGESHPQVLDVTVDGDRATVVIDGAGTDRPIWLRRERGRWLVDRVEYPI